MGEAAGDTAYQALFEANPHPMWVFERSSLRFLAVNDAAVRQYGYSRDEFLSLTILDIRPSEDVEAARSSVEHSLSEPKIWRHRRRDGSKILAEVTAHDLRFGGRDARLALALDVTLRERHAQLVQRTNRTLETVLQSAPVGLVVVNSRGVVTQANDTAKLFMGKGGLEPAEAAVQAVLGGAAGANDEAEMADGRWIEVAARPVDLDSGASGAVVVLTDATARREQEGRLTHDLEARTAALRASDEELEGFCFSVSHDLRSPLRAVDGFAQSVLTDVSASLSEENRESLERVRRAAKRMGDLIDGLLILSRILRADYAPIELDLSAIVRRAAEKHQRAHPQRRIRFEIASDQSAFGDPALVSSLVERLVENAVKFTRDRAEATIEFYPDGDGWAIRDDGAGFDMAYGSHLFKPYERLHAAGEFPGNGLGLAVAYRIVRRHGGTIHGKGVPGEGAEFRFSLASKENNVTEKGE